MNSVFSEQILADKLSMLNSTQQCIETLSHWCIFHQSKAELVVITWDKQFHNSEIAQQVPLLYLANDILQNSKRKGNEFVGEFWKVLPAALKKMIEKGDDRGKNVVTRLVDIWEERRVFGSRAQSLKELMLGEEAPPPLELSRKRSHSVRIVKRDSRSIRTKLSIGGEAEKIVSAYHLVQSEFSNEDAEMSKCNSAVQRIRKLERDFELACSNVKDPRRKTLAKELEDDETLLKQCIEKLKLGEANRAALVTQLKEALHGQESELENVCTQIQVAQAQAEESSNMRKKLNDDKYISDPRPSIIESLSTDANTKPKKSAAAIAAEVADKLAASTSSQYIMSSVLSTFAAEEAKNAGLTSSSSASNSFPSLPVNPAGANSMPNLENPISVSDPNMYTAAQTYSTQNHPYQSVMQSQAPLSQTHYQYMPPAGGIIGQYGYGSIAPLPAGPLQQQPPPYMMNSMVPLTPQPLQMTQQQSLSVTPPQPPAPPSFRPLQPPGMVYYAHHHNH